MKLAAVYDNESGRICKRFEDARVIKVYEVNDREIISTEMVGTMAENTSDIIGLIMMLDADGVICDEVSAETIELLDDEGIVFYSGFDEDADEAVEDLINGYVIFGPDDL